MQKADRTVINITDLLIKAGEGQLLMKLQDDFKTDANLFWDPTTRSLILGAGSGGIQLPDGYVIAGEPDLQASGGGYYRELYTNTGESDLNFTYTVPEGIDHIFVSMCGGGGGGSASRGTDGTGGGGAHAIISQKVAVTAGQQIPIRVGAKGKGGVWNVNSDNGYDGGSSHFNYNSQIANVEELIAPGGKGGLRGAQADRAGASGGPGGSSGADIEWHQHGAGGGSIWGAPGQSGWTKEKRNAGGWGAGGAGGIDPATLQQEGGDGSGGMILIEAASATVNIGGALDTALGAGIGQWVVKYRETQSGSQTNQVINAWENGIYLVVVDNVSNINNSQFDEIMTNLIIIDDYMASNPSAKTSGAGEIATLEASAYYDFADNKFKCTQTGDKIIEIRKYELDLGEVDTNFVALDSSTDGSLTIDKPQGTSGPISRTFAFPNFEGTGYFADGVRGVYIKCTAKVNTTSNTNGTVEASWPDGTRREIFRLATYPNTNTEISSILQVPVNPDQPDITIWVNGNQFNDVSAEVIGVQQLSYVVEEVVADYHTKSYASGGPYFFTVPSNTTEIWVQGTAGGGGGGGGRDYTNVNAGGGGQAGEGVKNYMIGGFDQLNPGDVIQISVGVGGAGGTGVASNQTGRPGHPGTDTVFGDILTLKGGQGGEGAINVTSISGEYDWGVANVTGAMGGETGAAGSDSAYFAGGTGGGTYGGGGGGASLFAVGGNGSAWNGNAWNDPSTLPPTPDRHGTLGSGGGGQGNTNNNSAGANGGAGGDGGDGFIIIKWKGSPYGQ